MSSNTRKAVPKRGHGEARKAAWLSMGIIISLAFAGEPEAVEQAQPAWRKVMSDPGDPRVLDNVQNPDVTFEDQPQKADAGSLLGAAVGALIGGLISGKPITTTEPAREGAPVTDLQSLVGAKGGQAEGTLTSKGYTYRGGTKLADSSFTYWPVTVAGTRLNSAAPRGPAATEGFSYAARDLDHPPGHAYTDLPDPGSKANRFLHYTSRPGELDTLRGRGGGRWHQSASFSSWTRPRAPCAPGPMW
ncbi:MAG: hypothetical protein QUV07_10965 [Cyanobium sp. CZS 25K]|nr:hypothetical protein [Cyanobium sp. CZS25K]